MHAVGERETKVKCENLGQECALGGDRVGETAAAVPYPSPPNPCQLCYPAWSLRQPLTSPVFHAAETPAHPVTLPWIAALDCSPPIRLQ